MEAARAQLEQQLALSRSQLADTRALMDSAQVSLAIGGRRGGGDCSRRDRLGPASPAPTAALGACSLLLPPPPDPPQSSVHSQLSQWKSLADDRESRLAQQAAAVHQLESELRQQHTKHEAALAELHLKHQQVGGLAS